MKIQSLQPRYKSRKWNFFKRIKLGRISGKIDCLTVSAWLVWIDSRLPEIPTWQPCEAICLKSGIGQQWILISQYFFKKAKSNFGLKHSSKIKDITNFCNLGIFLTGIWYHNSNKYLKYLARYLENLFWWIYRCFAAFSGTIKKSLIWKIPNSREILTFFISK